MKRHFLGKSHMEKCNLQNISWQSRTFSGMGGNASLSEGMDAPGSLQNG